MNDEREKFLLQINKNVMQYDTEQDVILVPNKYIGLNQFYLTMRHEISSLSKSNIQIRRELLRELLLQDFEEQSQELRKIGLGFVINNRL